MKLAKSWFAIVAAVLFLPAGTALAADKTQAANQATEKLAALLSESQIREMGERVGLFKKAGLSYQPSLVVPVEEVVGCKNKDQLRVLLGLYFFDANYALLFGKKQGFAAAYGQINDIADRLNLRGKLKFRTFTPDEFTKVLDNPDDPANRGLYLKYVSANVYEMLTASKSDQENLSLFLDVSYGAVVECLYASCKLALAAGSGEKLVALFNEQAARLDKFDQILAAYAGDPELDKLTQRSQRQRVAKPVAQILKTRKGNLAEADVVKVLSLIEPERSKVVGQCK
jgi:hypothetical protein